MSNRPQAASSAEAITAQPNSSAQASNTQASNKWRTPLALLSGALLPLSFAPFNIWAAAFVGLGLAYWLIKDVTTWRRGFAIGWFIGVGKYAVGASWIYVSIHEQGGASESLAGVLVGLFVAGMALFSSFFGALFGLTNATIAVDEPRGRQNLWLKGGFSVVLFAACWVIAEWCLTWLLTGFPWLFVGYGLMPIWFAGYAPMVGALGLSLLVCLVAASLVHWGEQMRARRGGEHQLTAVDRFAVPLLCLALLGGGYGAGQISWVTLGDGARVALVQGNIEQLTKWQPESVQPILTTYQTLSEPHWGTELMIWPEASITLFREQATPLLNRWDLRGKATNTALLLGLPDVERQADGHGSFQNTALAVGTGSGRYSKRRLVPFGEYVPLESVLRGLISFFDLPMSRSSSGPEVQPPMRAGAVTLGLAICYEIAYPELVRKSAETSEVLVTISNDSWFGASIGPHQHLQLAQMRALENSRYVLRATNNGVTAIIDPRGELVSTLPQFEPGVLTGAYYPATGHTPFTRFGHGPVLIMAFGLLLGGILRHV